MEKQKKRALRGLCAAVVLMLVSMLGAALIQTACGRVRVTPVSWVTSTGCRMSGTLFVPRAASADNPAPAVVVCHGMYNNKEMESAYTTELARRGFVVLAVDLLSHGDSESLPAADAMVLSADEALQLVRTLSCVDAARIGLEGHSMGGLCCEVATQMDSAAGTQSVAALLLNGCYATYADAATGKYVNAYGTRSVGIIAARYDEFLFRDADAAGVPTLPRDFITTPNAQSFLYFGTDPAGQAARAADTVYTDSATGALRVVYTPAATHTASIISASVTADVVAFFDQALHAPLQIPAGQQVWQVLAFFQVLGLAGFALFAAELAVLLVFTPFFASLRAAEYLQPQPVEKRARVWLWAVWGAAAAFGALVYLPIVIAAKSDATVRVVLPQNTTFGLGLWAAACGAFMLAALALYARRCGFDAAAHNVRLRGTQLGKTVLLAVLTAAAAYGWVFAARHFAGTDFRFWLLAARAFGRGKLAVALPYLPLFCLYFIAGSLAVNSFGFAAAKAGHTGRSLLFGALLTVLPAAILVGCQYICLFVTGDVLWSANDAHSMIVWLVPMLAILPASAVLSRRVYRVTNNPYLPGILNGILATLLCCANTSTWL